MRPTLFSVQFVTLWYSFADWLVASSLNILVNFQLKALRLIVDAHWYVSNTVIRKDLRTPTLKEEIRRYSPQYSARLSSHPNSLVVSYQTTGYCEDVCQMICLPDSFCNCICNFSLIGLVCKSHSQKPQEASNPSVTEERYWALFCIPLYTFIHNLRGLIG
jgi:hypothetical protein